MILSSVFTKYNSEDNIYKEHDCFILTKKIPNEDFVDVGTRGTVLMILSHLPPVYEVEFVTDEGRNFGNRTYTITEEFMQIL